MEIALGAMQGRTRVNEEDGALARFLKFRPPEFFGEAEEEVKAE